MEMTIEQQRAVAIATARLRLQQSQAVTTPDKGTVSVDQAKQAFAAQRTPDDRTTGQVVKDSVMNGLEGVGQFVAGLPSMAVDTGKTAINALDPSQMQQRVNAGLGLIQGSKGTLAPLANDAAALVSNKYDPSTPDQQRGYQNFAGQQLGGLLAAEGVAKFPSLVQALSDAIPSKARAGAKFSQVMGAAKDVPLDLSAADDAALRAQELAGRGSLPGRGSSMPKVVRDYLRTRESSPSMTYEAGRDFQSSAGQLSASEILDTKPVMKAQVAKLAKALADSNRAAAVKVGMGAEYDAAMSEYAKAANIAKMKTGLIDLMKNKAVQAGLGTGLGYGAYKAVSGH